jgi:hypothetical protein
MYGLKEHMYLGTQCRHNIVCTYIPRCVYTYVPLDQYICTYIYEGKICEIVTYVPIGLNEHLYLSTRCRHNIVPRHICSFRPIHIRRENM